MNKTGIGNQTFTDSRLIWGIMVLLCVGGLLSTLMLHEPGTPLEGKGPLAVYFAFPALISFSLYYFICPPKLILDSEGFRVKAPPFGRSAQWSETADFNHKKPIIGKGVVSYKAYVPYKGWCDSAFNFGFGLDQQELANILNTHRNMALRLKQDFPS